MLGDLDVFDGAKLREEIEEQAKCLRTAGRKLYAVGIELIDQKAVSEGSIALSLYLKMSESLRHLLGLNAPAQHAVQLAVSAEPRANTTDRIAAVLERLVGEQQQEQLVEAAAEEAKSAGQAH
jgi:hypothetical protein